MIYVLGSINNDMSLEVERMPKKGETVAVESCTARLGGKGALQAVTIARLGNREDSDKPAVRLIGRVGNDGVGAQLMTELKDYGVDTTYVRQVKRATGMTVSTATSKDTRVLVYGGANNGLSKTDVDEALENADHSDTLLCQTEIPLYVVVYALRKARSLGMTTILNPSPAKSIPDDVYCNVDIIVPNAEETFELTGIHPTDFNAQKNAMRFFHARGVQYVVLTLGDNGCSLSDGAYVVSHIPPYRSAAVDTSAAGDAFVGALALTYPHTGMYSFEEACAFATKTASITVSRRGCAESIPNLAEVCELYNKYIED